MDQKQEMEYWVSVLTADQQGLKFYIRREIFLEASKDLKEIWQKKTRSATPTVAAIKNIFL
jgi:hypothetical protein